MATRCPPQHTPVVHHVATHGTLLPHLLRDGFVTFLCGLEVAVTGELGTHGGGGRHSAPEVHCRGFKKGLDARDTSGPVLAEQQVYEAILVVFGGSSHNAVAVTVTVAITLSRKVDEVATLRNGVESLDAMRQKVP